MKNSIYEYSYADCKAVKMPSNTGYTWYDIAMFDVCKKLTLALMDCTHLYKDELYITLKELNDYIMTTIILDKHNNSYEHRYNYLHKLCNVQLAEINSKYTKNPKLYEPLIESFHKYYNCLCEYSNLNNLEIKTLEIINYKELFGYPHIRMLFDRMSRVTTKVTFNAADIKLLSDSYQNAYYEIEDARVSTDTKTAAKDYLNATEAYIETLKKIQQNKKR